MHELSPGSPLRSVLSSAVIKLNEDGVIMQLKEKWWKRERGGGSCSHVSSTKFFQRNQSYRNQSFIFFPIASDTFS